MKAQATVHSITKKPNAPEISTTLTITVENGVPKLAPGKDNTNVATGDQVTWTCTPGIAGTLTLYFDPFHYRVFASGTASNQNPTITLGPFTVVSEQPAKGQPGKAFHYHISWTDSVHGTHGHDPIIIVDPTNTPKK
jgi:hypothetical protein